MSKHIQYNSLRYKDSQEANSKKYNWQRFQFTYIKCILH